MKQFIALCGAPGAGKSEAQRLLKDLYGYEAVDDSRILREAAMILYGLEEWHVTTQEGKSTFVTVGDNKVTVRKLLGDLGKHLEKRDPHHMPRRAMENALKSNPNALLSFGSVRMDQATVFKATGNALVVEVKRDGFDPVNDFDHYDTSLVDVTITNNFDPDDMKGSLERLHFEITQKVKPLL